MENQFRDFSAYGDKKLDIFTLSLIPQHIRMSCPNFVKFIELWLKKISEKGEGAEFIHNMLYYANIDETSHEFLEKFCKNYLKPLQYHPEVNKKTLVKWIKQWYESVGSQQSFKFLFRVLFNENVDFYFPSIDILRPSDGKWAREYILRAYRHKDENGNFRYDDSWYENMEGTVIIGLQSKAQALVERVSLRHYDGSFDNKDYKDNADAAFEYDCINFYVSEISYKNPISKFREDEYIICYHMNNTDDMWVEQLTHIVSEITLNEEYTDKNIFYEVNDPIYLQSPSGYGCIAIVSSVSTGHFDSMTIVEPGTNYEINDRISISDKYGRGFYAIITKVSEGYLIDSEKEHILQVAESQGFSQNQVNYISNCLNQNAWKPIFDLENNTLTRLLNEYLKLHNIGAIEEIRVVQQGEGYKTFPEVHIASRFGKGAHVIPNPVGVGAIKTVALLNPGFAYNEKDELSPTFQEEIVVDGVKNYPREDENYAGDLYGDSRNTTPDLEALANEWEAAPMFDREKLYTQLSEVTKNIMDELFKRYNPYTFPIRFVRSALRTIVYMDQVVQFEPIEGKVKGEFKLGDIVIGSSRTNRSTKKTIYNRGVITKINYENNVMLIKLDDFTFDFYDGDEIMAPHSGVYGYRVRFASHPNSKQFNVDVGPVAKVPPYYRNRDGWLDSEKNIQDSYYYQCFSYALITDVPKEKWYETVEEHMNPTGFVCFHNYGNDNLISCSYGGSPVNVYPRNDTCIPCSERVWVNDEWSKVSICKAYKAYNEN